MGREDRIVRPVRLPPRGPAVDQASLVDLAQGLGRRLEQLALQNDTGAHWLGVGPLDESTWGVHPTGIDLYAGSSGIAFFLAYLGEVTGEPAPTELARRAVSSLRSQLRLLPGSAASDTEDDPDGSSLTVGAFDGLSSVIHLLTHVGVLWDADDLLDDAEDLVQRLPALVARDTHLDVLYGSAGGLLSLLGLHSVRPSQRTLDVAIACGDRLLAAARPMPVGVAWTTLADQPPLGGFSHGTAGIACSLLRLAAATGQARYRECALHALEYDRSLFVPELDNWADLRSFPSRARSGEPAADAAGQNSMVAWCHGAAGIGMARLATLDQLDDAETRADIDTALRATRAYGFHINHCLCHGALGNVELLLAAARTLDRGSDRDALHRATAEVVRSIQVNGPVTGVPLGVETPGFMTGLAGMGYELLRLAAPHAVPSALLLSAPRRRG